MFIVWRTKPITSTRPVELLVEHFDTAEGRARLGGLRLPEGKMDPLICRHSGPGRASLTPLLMHAERIEGKPRQKFLHRFPSARTCCLKDVLFRAGWWCTIHEWAATLEDDRNHTEEEQLFFHRDRKAIFAKLREVVPTAPPAAREPFTDYRSRKEAKARREHEAYMEQVHQQARRQREEEARREREMQERLRRQLEEMDEARRQLDELDREAGRDPTTQRGRTQAPPREPWTGGQAPWWRVLGVPPMATLDEVKAAYRKLAMQHHPDRGGDAQTFQRVQAAYEQARTALERR